MKKLQKNNYKNVSGFTIIEILVVIVISTVLFAVIIFGVTMVQREARFSTMRTILDDVLKKSERDYIENGNLKDFFSNNITQINEMRQYIMNWGGTAIVFTWPVPELENWCICGDAQRFIYPTSSYCVDSTGYRKEVPRSCGSDPEWRCVISDRTPPASCID